MVRPELKQIYPIAGGPLNPVREGVEEYCDITTNVSGLPK